MSENLTEILSKELLVDNKSINLRKRNLCIPRKDIFYLKRVDGTISSINNEIVSIVKKFYNDILYKYAEQRERKPIC